MQPSVGRVVHYVSYGTPGGEYASVCRSATVAEVGAWMHDPNETEIKELVGLDGAKRRTILQVFEPEACALVVSNPTGQFFNVCRHDEGQKPGTWHWPERV